MFERTRRYLTSLFVAGALAVGAVATAEAQNQQDGLVNVYVGSVEILNDADIAVAAEVVAQICGVDVGPIVVLGEAVDARGGQRVVCRVDDGAVRISQNR